MFNRALELRIALAPNDVKSRDRHFAANQLIDWIADLNSLMLALIADEDDAVDAGALSQAQQPVQLARREQARFVDKPKLVLRWFNAAIFKQAGHCPGQYSRLAENLDAAAGWSETAHRIAALLSELADRAHGGCLRGACPTLDGGNPIAGGNRHPRRLNLIGEKAALDRPLRCLYRGGDRRCRAVSSAHHRDILSFEAPTTTMLSPREIASIILSCHIPWQKREEALSGSSAS
ncbi:MAG TPA: hypothetical protein VMD75_02815 [Candidatus Binataceae bacterium]|nr:hypothetical protein [Candidatus Binataceae bacterium]